MTPVPEPFVSLAATPTPVDRLDTFCEETGADLYVKRDDATGGPTQGNKLRKLEYLLGDAVESGADTVVTLGGRQSNHCRTTAIAARRLGLDPHLLLLGDEPDTYDGNLLLDELVGAEVEYLTPAEYYENRRETLESVRERLEAAGRSPYVVPAGGTNGLGILGYVRAYGEIRDWAEEHDVSFDAIYAATGSGGTYAGLLAGVLHHGDDVDVVGVNVTPYTVDELQAKIVGAIEEATTVADLELESDPVGHLSILTDYLGPGYAEPADADLAIIAAAGEREGLVLDTCYTGKAFRGFVERVEPGETALFVHTGGSYGLFPRRERLSAAL